MKPIQTTKYRHRWMHLERLFNEINCSEMKWIEMMYSFAIQRVVFNQFFFSFSFIHSLILFRFIDVAVAVRFYCRSCWIQIISNKKPFFFSVCFRVFDWIILFTISKFKVNLNVNPKYKTLIVQKLLDGNCRHTCDCSMFTIARVDWMNRWKNYFFFPFVLSCKLSWSCLRTKQFLVVFTTRAMHGAYNPRVRAYRK